MSKANEYKQGMCDGLEPFGEKINNVEEQVRSAIEIIDDIIDCIEWNVENPEELVRKLKEARAKREKPKQFRISIVYKEKENRPFVDALRKDLNNLKNSCEAVDYISFTKHVGSLVDYRIYVGNLEKVKEENCLILYKAYGMRILQKDDSYIIIYDPKYRFSEGEKERFISYYESVISKSLEKSKEAEKVLNSRKNRKAKNSNPAEPKVSYSAAELVEQAFNSSIDFWKDKPLWMTVIFGLPSAVGSFVTAAIALLCLVPVGISEMVLRDTVDKLREADFDSKFVANAQRQILEIKIVDLFWQEQIKGLQNNNAT